MKIIIKFSSEITIKSRAIRSYFLRILIQNIRIVLKHNNQSIIAICYWDYIEVKLKYKNNDYLNIIQILMSIPGIHHFLLVKDSIIFSLEDIYHQMMLQDCIQFTDQSFCIRVKRRGNHVYTSQEIESYLGHKLCNALHNVCVNLKKPNKIINLEIKNNNLFIIIKRYEGLGGFPIGTQRECLSLISGGFDSSVASYMMMNRGSKVHYCFFNLSNSITHTIEVYKIIFYLWNKFGSSHKVNIVTINFLEVVKEISSKIKINYIGIVLKRMMIRAAIIAANQWKIKALVTGEVLGQVSSQTLDNLVLINNVKGIDYIILRPLIAYDKEQIIKLAKKIGTEVLSRTVPEYCGIISKHSTTKANKEYLELEENKCDLSIINKAMAQADIINVKNISKLIDQPCCIIHTQTKVHSTDIILDIRTKNEQEDNPLQLPSHIKIKKIPFYQLLDQFPKLDQKKIYLLYCQNGIMSRLQAIHLYQQGFKNIKIYQVFKKK